MFPSFFVNINDVLDKYGINTYIIFMAIGLIVMFKYIIYMLENNYSYSKMLTNKILIILFISLSISYLFASFFDSLYHYLDDGVFSGGITYISGFIGGILSFITLVYIFLKIERKHIMKLLNIIIPGIILAHAIGRIGCFSVGSCYGKATSSIFGVYFPKGTNPYYDGISWPIHPTQLYEAIFLFILFFVITKTPKIKDNKFILYLISYGIFRFIIEKFFRGDDRGILFGFPPSLVLSLILFLVGTVMLILKYKEKIIKLKKV